MARDCRGNKRGRCLVCIECKEFESWERNIRCAYCDCPPTKHEYCTEKEALGSSSAGGQDLIDGLVATEQAHQPNQEEVAIEEGEDGNEHGFTVVRGHKGVYQVAYTD